jgi:hypothetical protein
MPDVFSPQKQWSDAFAALPLEQPAPDSWSRITAQLDRRRARRWPLWLATAAALLLAIALPWRLSQHPATIAPSAPAVATTVTATDPLEQLYAESAQLEALLAMTRDERVSTGTAAAMAGDLDGELASIDAALMQPDLPRARQLALWRQRVDALRSVVGFEGTRRWLAARGDRYDGALVMVD